MPVYSFSLLNSIFDRSGKIISSMDFSGMHMSFCNIPWMHDAMEFSTPPMFLSLYSPNTSPICPKFFHQTEPLICISYFCLSCVLANNSILYFVRFLGGCILFQTCVFSLNTDLIFLSCIFGLKILTGVAILSV